MNKKINISAINSKMHFIYKDEREKNVAAIVIYNKDGKFFFDHEYKNEMSNLEVEALLLRGALVDRGGKYYRPSSFNENNVSFSDAVINPEDIEVDLSGYATIDVLLDYTNGKKQRYITQEEFDNLSEAEKNDTGIVWNVTDGINKAHEHDNKNVLDTISQEKIDEWDSKSNFDESMLEDYAKVDDIPTKISQLTNDSNYVTESRMQIYVAEYMVGGDGTGISSITDAELDAVLISVFGELYVPQIYGEIIASVTNLSINEGGNKTFTVALSQAPSYDQVIEVKSNNTNVTVSPNTLIFNADNYNAAQIVTVNVSLDGLFTDYDANVLLENDRAINKNITVNIVNTEEFEEIPCTSLQLSQTSLNLEIGDVVDIIASPIPSNTTDTVLWSASNGNCKVENGVVTAISSGDCIVTAICGDQSATCSINIVESVVASGLLYYDFSTVSNSITVEDIVGDNDAILGANRSADTDGAVDLTGTYLVSSNNITLDGDFEIDTILSCNNGNSCLFAIGDLSNTTGKYVTLKNSYGTLQAQIVDSAAQQYNQVSSISGTSYTTEYFHVVMSKVGNTLTLTVNDAVQGNVNVTADIFPLSSKIYIAKELRDGTETVLSRNIKIKSFKII